MHCVAVSCTAFYPQQEKIREYEEMLLAPLIKCGFHWPTDFHEIHNYRKAFRGNLLLRTSDKSVSKYWVTELYHGHVVSTSPSWRTTPCRLSATAYSIYSQLPSISAGRSSNRNLRTRHAVVTGTHGNGGKYFGFFTKGGLVKKLENWHSDAIFNNRRSFSVQENSFLKKSSPVLSDMEAWKQNCCTKTSLFRMVCNKNCVGTHLIMFFPEHN